MASVWSVVAAAGRGSRFGSDVPKQFLEIAGISVLQHSVNALLAHPSVIGVMVALDERDLDTIELTGKLGKSVFRCLGGATRAESVNHALAALSLQGVAAETLIAVHDGARPCLAQQDLDAVLNAAEKDRNGAILAVPTVDTLKRSSADRRVLETLNRSEIWAAQTPQVFRLGALRAALAQAPSVTDEAQAMEGAGMSAVLVRGHASNIKITVADDLALAEFYLGRNLRRND